MHGLKNMATYVKDNVVKCSHGIRFFLNLSFEKDEKNNLFDEQNSMLLVEYTYKRMVWSRKYSVWFPWLPKNVNYRQ